MTSTTRLDRLELIWPAIRAGPSRRWRRSASTRCSTSSAVLVGLVRGRLERL